MSGIGKRYRDVWQSWRSRRLTTRRRIDAGASITKTPRRMIAASAAAPSCIDAFEVLTIELHDDKMSRVAGFAHRMQTTRKNYSPGCRQGRDNSPQQNAAHRETAVASLFQSVAGVSYRPPDGPIPFSRKPPARSRCARPVAPSNPAAHRAHYITPSFDSRGASSPILLTISSRCSSCTASE